MKRNIKDIVIISVSLVLVVILITISTSLPKIKFSFLKEAGSATYYDLHGQAWSDTVGWFSVNCQEGGPTGNNICATSNYKVSTDATGILTGYAWSDNVGWITFSEDTGCPSAPCRGQLNAGGLTGWARVLSPFVPTDPHPDRGGWDGWIDLSQVTRSGNDLRGAAWGDINLGWLSMNCIDGGPTNNNICGTSNYKVYLSPNIIPDPTLTLNIPSHAYVGDAPTFTWTASNVDTCAASGGWSGARPVTGAETVSAYVAQGTYVYQMDCHNDTYNLDVSATRSVDVTNGICDTGETVPGDPYDCTSKINRFESNPKIVKEGGSSRLEWTIEGAQSCRLYSPTNVVLQNIPNGNSSGTYPLTNVVKKDTYRISCLGNVNIYATVSVYLLYEY